MFSTYLLRQSFYNRVEQSVTTQKNNFRQYATKKTEAKVTPFPKWNMNIKMTMHMLTSLLYLCYNEHVALCKQLNNWSMAAKSTNLCNLSRRKAPKTQQFKHSRKNSNFFSHLQPGRYVGARKNIAYLGSHAKVFVAVQSIIPWSRNSMFVVVVALRYQS